MFIKITQVFFTAAKLWGRDSVGYYARSYYSERKVFKFKIYIYQVKQNSGLADSVIFVMNKKPNIATIN